MPRESVGVNVSLQSLRATPGEVANRGRRLSTLQPKSRGSAPPQPKSRGSAPLNRKAKKVPSGVLQITEENLPNSDFAVSADNRVKIKESDKRPCQITKKKTMTHEGDSDTNCNRCTRNIPQRFGKGTRRLRNKRTCRDHLDYCMIKISQNIKKSHEDLWIHSVTQTPVKDYAWELKKTMELESDGNTNCN